jgi:hypothetical protein
LHRKKSYIWKSRNLNFSTVRWSNFDPRDPKMGVFLQSAEATPCGHLLKWRLTPRKPPCGHHSWPPWPWFSCEKPVKIFKVRS